MGLCRRERRRRRMVKLSAFFMEWTRSQQHEAISRNRKQKQKRKRKGIDGNIRDNKLNHTITNDGGIDKLPDDVLFNILSRVSIKEAARTSVLGRRWRYLWRFVFGTLQFDYSDPSTGDGMEWLKVRFKPWEKFEAWVSTVLELHQGGYIEGMVISFDGVRPMMSRDRATDSWVYFALQKEVERFELHLPWNEGYEFPGVEMLMSHSGGGHSPFGRLRTLRLADVEIKDEVVNYFLASCPNLEQLCISFSEVTKNLRVVDPPSLRVLEISKCSNIKSLEISAGNLVSLAYGGKRNGLLLKKIPNLRKLSISDDFYFSFVSEPKEHSWYVDQLVELVVELQLPSRIRPIVTPYLGELCSLRRLEVKVYSAVGRSLLFFTSFIKASPQLCEFRIEMGYLGYNWESDVEKLQFPAISGVKFDHKCLKVVEMCGYVGCSSEEELLSDLVKKSRLIERVAIDTHSDYYDNPDLTNFLSFQRDLFMSDGFSGTFPETGATTRAQSKERAKHFVSTFPTQIQFTVT